MSEDKLEGREYYDTLKNAIFVRAKNTWVEEVMSDEEIEIERERRRRQALIESQFEEEELEKEHKK